ncbi:MAG: hypothetical protein GY870_16730 [archaeon]|nr:hypothetical protein [archaeon]
MDENIFLCLFFGLCFTVQSHIAKAMQRQGIEIFDRKPLKEKGKKPLIWIIGYVLNTVNVVWQVLGSYFGSSVQFLSVFGLGLIVLVLYAWKVMNEHISSRDLIGFFFIILGTVLNGIILIGKGYPEEKIPANIEIFLFLLVVFFLMSFLFIFISKKKGLAPSLIFGIVTGITATFDAIMKRIGMTNYPAIFLLIVVFSMFIGLLSFIIMNYGYAQGAEASKLLPIYNSIFILLPIIIEPLIFNHPAFIPNPLQFVSIALASIGIFLLADSIAKIMGPTTQNEIEIS